MDYKQNPKLKESVHCRRNQYYIFDTWIFDKMRTDGPAAAFAQIEKWGIDVFAFGLLLFPIFYSGHFSLFIVANCGLVMERPMVDDQNRPYTG